MLLASAPSNSEAVSLDSKTASRMLIHFVKPEYPPVAKVNYIEGQVKVIMVVNREGSVVETHVLSGEPLLAAAALKAVRQWRFRPFRQSNGGKPFRTFMTVNFNLSARKIGEFPRNPNQYFEKQIQPPQVVAQPQDGGPGIAVPLKVLVGSDGEVLDAVPLPYTGQAIQDARPNLHLWRFRPAHWGTLAVPWYLVVKVSDTWSECRRTAKPKPSATPSY